MKKNEKFYKKFIKAKTTDVKNEYEKLKDLRNRIVHLC